MPFMVVLGGLFALGCVVFALQNNVATTVNVFLWRFDSSLAVVLLLAFIAGALSAVLFTTPSALRARLAAARQRRAVRSLTEEIEQLRRNAQGDEPRAGVGDSERLAAAELSRPPAQVPESLPRGRMS